MTTWENRPDNDEPKPKHEQDPAVLRWIAASFGLVLTIPGIVVFVGILKGTVAIGLFLACAWLCAMFTTACGVVIAKACLAYRGPYGEE